MPLPNQVPAALPSFVRHMESVNAHREQLSTLRGVWDTLALLGHLSPTGVNMSEVRESFERLSEDLVSALADELLRRVEQRLGCQAQIAMNVLNRNLFERTADVSFLATDAALVAAMALPDDVGLADLRRRLGDYVAKYSVYRDVVLLDPSGRVVTRLHTGFEGTTVTDIVARACLADGYVETYAPSDLCGGGWALTYAEAVKLVVA